MAKNNEIIPRKPREEPVQLQLFQSTGQLNLSAFYEAMPKDIAPNSKEIIWESKSTAQPVKRYFNGEDNRQYELTISTIQVEDIKKKGTFRTIYPYHRESRIEHALMTLATQQYVFTEYNNAGVASYKMRCTYYQIQKLIVEAINIEQGRELKPNDCPYNVASIRQALRILKGTNYEIKSLDGKVPATSFNRILHFQTDGKHLVIEFGPMIAECITSGTWAVADSIGALASSTYYEMKLRTYLHLKFTFAKKGVSFNASLERLMEKIGLPPYKTPRDNIRKVLALLESLDEVEKVDVDMRKEGRKIVSAVFHIFPSESFVSRRIYLNKLNKQAKNALVDEEMNLVMIEPREEDFASRTLYDEAVTQYRVKLGKFRHSTRFLSSKNQK